MKIFVPPAYYICAYRMKSVLEAISFKYLKPEKYKEIEDEINSSSIENNNCLNEMLLNIEEILNNESILHKKVLAKNIYGVYIRIDGVESKISNIHDLLLKIIVDDIKNCYITLQFLLKRK